MPDNRHIRAKKNILTSLLSQIVVLLCGIIVPRLMIGAFGSEAYGATTSIAQFLSYIALLEGGIGGVARAVLYKPLSENDTDTMGYIMGEIKKFFRVVAFIFGFYVLILAFGFKSVSHLESMEWFTSFLLVIVISISTFGQYYIGISNAILLQAAQKSYITNLISIGATIINAVSTVLLVYFNCSLIIVKLISSCIFFMRPVVMWLYVKKNYSFEARIDKTKTYLKAKWTGLGQHIAFFLHSNTDIVVLTVMADLSMVAVYSVYNMIISHMQNLAMSFVSGMEALFGDMIARNEKEKLKVTFSTYENILSLVSIILFSSAAVLIVPFIKIYMSGITDTNYTQPVFAVIMTLTALSYCLRLPYHSAVIAAGHFKETKLSAYGEAFINIGLSVVLVYKFGLIGVAAATLIATWFRFIYYVIYLSKNIFNREIKLFIKRFIINLTTLHSNFIVGYLIVSAFDISDYFSWVICGAVTSVVITVITFIINFCFYKNDSIQLVKKFIKGKQNAQ
ncbi:MAG: sugar isomerase [Ruminococcaceae bacterium]|nr:sugar isomerase [Oscillospiraceae bacterium]